jgi:hypothetical protein
MEVWLKATERNAVTAKTGTIKTMRMTLFTISPVVEMDGGGGGGGCGSLGTA